MTESSISLQDLVSTAPGTLAGRYMRMYWHPVYRASDLRPGYAVPLRVMSEDFTLYRGESGDAHLVDFRCAHRGSQLNVGWVEGDCIRCRYHGWMYDGSGQCVDVPGADLSFTARMGIRSYPLNEYLGLLWAYLGEGEPPPPRRFPNHERPGVLEVTAPEWLPCNLWSRLENDAPHVPWTHRVSRSRAGDGAEVLSHSVVVQAVEKPWGFDSIVTNAAGRTRSNHAYMPNGGEHTSGESELLPGKVFSERITYTVPVDDESTMQYGINLLLVSGEEEKIVREKLAQKEQREGTPAWRLQMGADVLAGRLRLEDMDPSLSTYDAIRIEDHGTMVGQGPAPDWAHEHLGPLDAIITMKRMLWLREVQAMVEGRPLTDWRMPDDEIDKD